MTKPKYVIYTYCELHEIKKRIRIRNRYHEKFYTDEYLACLFKNAEKMADEYKNEFTFVKYDTTNYLPKEIALSFLTYLKNQFMLPNTF
jgi:deoxyadenosine/deoxycytidine kinase